MKFEHFALNVEDPLAMKAWYVKNLGLKVVKGTDKPPYTTFMADSSGDILLEIYLNPTDQVPDYRKMDPLLVHLAFVSLEPEQDRESLEKAGAVTVSNTNLPDGSHLIMMRDPWGLAIQLCKRSSSMLQH